MRNAKKQDPVPDLNSKTSAEANRSTSVEDFEDLELARETAGEPTVKAKPWYRCIGPGLITGAADDDPSGIGTYSSTGAAFGYAHLWLITLCLPLMIAVQEMCGRLGLVTGRGIAAVLKEHYPKWLLYSCVLLLVVTNTLNVFADLNVMAASIKLLVGGPTWVWLTAITVALVGLQVFVSYRRYAGILKWSCLALVSYVVVALLPGVHNDWKAIAQNLVVPAIIPRADYLLAGVAFLGTTISPYLFFWQAGETVEEVVAEGLTVNPGERTTKVKKPELQNLRADTVTGMVASQLVAMFIIISTAGTLFVSGHRHIETAQDAAMALKPLGPMATTLFCVGMIGTGFLAIPTLAGSAAYAAAEAFSWPYGLFRRYSRAQNFYLTVAGVVVVGYVLNFFSKISPVTALVYSAVLNGIVAVPLVVVLVLICNNQRIVGKYKNGFWSNLGGIVTILFMGAASVVLIWSLVTGHGA